MITNPVTGQSPDTCNITVTADSEQGSVSGGGKATKGMNVVVQAVENTRYSFSAWKENGSQVATSASYQFTVAKDRDLQATFTEKKKAGKYFHNAFRWHHARGLSKHAACMEGRRESIGNN